MTDSYEGNPDAGAEPETTDTDHQADAGGEPVDVGEAFARNGLDADQVPGSADQYELASTGNPAIDEALTASLEHGDPKLDWFSRHAAELGLTQRQYNTIIQEYVAGTLGEQPDVNEELAKLPNGPARLDRVEKWAAETLDPAAQRFLAQQPVTAEWIGFLEAIADAMGQPLNRDEQSGQQSAKMLKAEVRELQQTEAYRRGDPRAVNAVRAKFKQLSTLRARGQLS